MILTILALLMGHNDFQTRQQAEEALNLLWPTSVFVLQWAEDSKDPEIRWRAKRTIERNVIPGPPFEPWQEDHP